MSTAAIFVGIGSVLLLALLWVTLAGIRAILEQETVGQLRRAARGLLLRSTRRLPEPERVILTQRLFRRLNSKDLEDRPLSQFLFAFNRWIATINVRHTYRLALAWLGGTNPHLTQRFPRERSMIVPRAFAVLSAGAVTALTDRLPR